MNETILIVDDDPLLREVYKTVTQDAGYNVVVAGSGQEAITHFIRLKDLIQLVLTDVNMPGMAGPDLISNLRNIKPDIKTIYMSGLIQGDDSTGTTLDSAVLLPKPFSSLLLLETIRAVLDDRAKF